MKNKILLLLFLAITLPHLSFADNFVNLTPRPRSMSVAAGALELPQQFSVTTEGLPTEMSVEVTKFLKAFNAATGYEATIGSTASAPLLVVRKSATPLKEEGYKIEITSEGATVEASTPVGLYYAFQSIKKMLPPNVMAGVADAKVSQYTLPLCKISDSPAYDYRGFMLDTSRHFFSVEELKRVLEVMSYYKMNRFHWHMTDDQGWRVEIKKYPRLTAIGSISDNSYMVDMRHGDYWLNRPYGPLFYTQEQVREVVAYAQERHIEIVPEIDMPGHFSAAMAAYPEFSCTPDGNHGVVSNIGGIYSDVLNVANPQAIQFAKDILTEIMDLFPGEYIHIGGDECPTTAWERNAECIAKKEAMGLKSFRELQSHFIKDMAEHLQANGRKISVWNEAISSNGADTQTIKETGATVYCWAGADAAVSKASSLGLKHIYTPQVPWYINRKQSTDPGEPVGAGRGTDNLEVVYRQNIPVQDAHYFKGVQATFWSEYVAFGDYLEYLMLPRLVAIAEAGWTPRNLMNFSNFCRRITADSTLYNYNNYQYGKHYMVNQEPEGQVLPQISTPKKPFWYRLVSQATDVRAHKCIELLREDSPLLETYAGKGAEAGRLWTAEQAAKEDAAYDYQFWALEESADRPGHFALVCKAFPNGSLSPMPTAKNNTGRWSYDLQQKHYHFILADNGYGKDGENYYYSIRCDEIDGLWLNAALAGQGFAVNLYNNPSDGNGGLWEFVPQAPTADGSALLDLIQEAQRYLKNVRTYSKTEEKQPGYFGAIPTEALRQLISQTDVSTLSPDELQKFTLQFNQVYDDFRKSFGYLEKGKLYTLTNAVFTSTTICDGNQGDALQHTDDIWADNVWEVTESQIHEDYTQTVQFQNVQTHRFIGNAASTVTPKIGYAVHINAQGHPVHCTFLPETQDFIVSIDGKNLFPIHQDATTWPGTICAGADSQSGNAIRPQGAAWQLAESRVITFTCYDENDQLLGTFRRSWPLQGADPSLLTPPMLPNHEFVETVGEKSYYRRTAYSVQLICQDEQGALLSVQEEHCPVGQSFIVKLPQLPYYNLYASDYENGTQIQPDRDLCLIATYHTDALSGVKALGEAVTRLQDGHSYVIYDLSPNDGARRGYRNANSEGQVMRGNTITDTHPNYTWQLEAKGKGFKVKNGRFDEYVPVLKNSTPAILSKTGDTFTFSLNSDGSSWKIKGSNGVCWDGLASGALVGWNDPGHPYQIYQYYVQPYFKVRVYAEDVQGQALAPVQETLVKAGEPYTLVAAQFDGYTLKEVQGGDALNEVSAHLEIKVIYEDEQQTGIDHLTTHPQTEGIFDLSGRRLLRIGRPGIYIINGQKVLVK